MTLLLAANIVLLILGCYSAWLVSHYENDKKFLGFQLSLLCQPLWLYTQIATANYGVALLSFWYAYTSFNGLRNHK